MSLLTKSVIILTNSLLRSLGRGDLENILAILAVEKVAHRPSPSFVRFLQSLAFVGVDACLGHGLSLFGFAARRAAIRETGFTGLQLELF